MPANLQEQSETRERILDEASQLFADKGFKSTTVREICRAAKVNLAAINYHFRDKEQLYIELIKRAHQGRAEQVPLPNWTTSTPPEQKLRDFIRILLMRILEGSTADVNLQLMLREIAQPTAACTELVRDYIRPHFQLLLGILSELLPADTSERCRHLVAFSIVGQCMYHRVAQPVVRMVVGPDEHATYSTELLADQIARFSLAALGRGTALEGSPS